jgi:integrase
MYKSFSRLCCRNQLGNQRAPPAIAESGHLRRSLRGSRWAVIRGWHIARHSFASNCAAKGIDQRLIDRWLGHTTDEMRRRYQHLIPNQEQQAIGAVFG